MKNIRTTTVLSSIIQLILCFCIINLLILPRPVGAAMIYPPEVSAFSAVVIDADSGLILYQKNKNEILYPASVTKIMTALLAAEYYTDYEQLVTFSESAVTSLPFDSSSIAMNVGEVLTVDNAMYGLLLASANEVANALAENISGSIEGFAERMSIRAWELGAYNSKFTNPHGLHDENHYSTAYDMAIIMREAIKHPELIKYISTQSHSIPPTSNQPLPRPLTNSNKMIITSSEFYNEDVVGGKTGFTDEAMHTLVTYASRDGVNLIVSIFHGDKNEPYIDTKALLDYGFAVHSSRIEEDTAGVVDTYVEYNPPRPVSKPLQYVINEAGYEQALQVNEPDISGVGDGLDAAGDLAESNQQAERTQETDMRQASALNGDENGQLDAPASKKFELKPFIIPMLIALAVIIIAAAVFIIAKRRNRRRYRYGRLNSYGSYSKYGRLK